MYWDEWPVAQPSLLFGAVVFHNKEWLSVWNSDYDFSIGQWDANDYRSANSYLAFDGNCAIQLFNGVLNNE